MKILFVTNMYPTADHVYNGIHVKEQIEYLVNKYSIDHDIEFINGGKSTINYIKSIFNINRMIYKNRYDIVHTHFGLSGLFLLFNPFNKTPVILTLHGSDTHRSKKFGMMLKISEWVVVKANRTIIVSDRMFKIFPRHTHKLVNIPCGINMTTFNVSRKNNRDVFRIGFPGDKERSGKNFSLFRQIVDLLTINGNKIEIVEFHNLTRDEVVSKLSSLDCLLMTSLYEGSPQVVKEAMVAGVPIVSTNVGDVNRVLAGVNNCYVVDSFDAEDFITPIENIIRLDFRERVTTGKKRIEELMLDQDSVVSRIFNLYNRTIKRGEEKN